MDLEKIRAYVYQHLLHHHDGASRDALHDGLKKEHTLSEEEDLEVHRHLDWLADDMDRRGYLVDGVNLWKLTPRGQDAAERYLDEHGYPR